MNGGGGSGGAKRQGGGASKASSGSKDHEGEAHLGKNKRPDLIGTRPCERFLNGHCNFGKDCWFVHEGEPRVDTSVKSALPTPQPVSTSPDPHPPKPKISLAPTNPWGKVKIPPAEEASPVVQESPPRSPVPASPQASGSPAPPPPLARPMPMPVMNGGAATSQPAGAVSPPPPTSAASAVSSAMWEGALGSSHLSEPLNDVQQISSQQREMAGAGGSSSALQQQLNDQAQREAQMRQQIAASQQASQPQPGSQQQPGQQPPQSQMPAGQQAMYRMPQGSGHPQMGAMGMGPGGGMPQMAFMQGGRGTQQQQQAMMHLQAQAQASQAAQAQQARAQAQAHAQMQAQAHAQAQHAAQQQAQKQRAQQIAQMQQAQAAAQARQMQAQQLAHLEAQNGSREVSPATGAPQHHHLHQQPPQQAGGEMSMESMSAALPAGMSDFGARGSVDSSPAIGPSLGMGSGGMQQRPSLEQPAGQFADLGMGQMTGSAAGGSALGSGFLGQQRGSAGGSAGAGGFAPPTQQQQWNMFGAPADGGDVLSAGGLGLGGARQARDESGMFGGMSDVFSTARMGLYESHDTVDQPPHGDPFGSGDYGGFNMYQGGLGGSEWMPPNDESGAGLEDQMGDPLPRYQHF